MIKIVAVLILFLLSGGGITAQQKKPVLEILNEPPAETRIPDAVAQHGDISLSHEPGEGRTLDELLAESRMAVIGRIVSSQSRLSHNGLAILTDFRLAVEEVLFSDRPASLPKHKRLRFTMLGGKLQFPSGTADYASHLAFPVGEGQRYLVLLTACNLETPHDPADALAPVGGPQGLFLLQGESLIPAASASYPIAEQALAMSLQQFKSNLPTHR